MYRLSNDDIEKVSAELTSIMEAARVSSQGITKIRLTAEDLLLRYQDRFGPDTELTLLHTKRFGKLTVTLRLRCESFDPMADLSEEDFWLRNMLLSLGYMPTWTYKNHCNELSFPVRCESLLPSWASTVIACGLGIVFGLAARLLPEGILSVMTDTVLSPVSSAIMGFLSAVSAMLIFLSIINGVVGMGNLSTLNRIGKKLIGQFLLSMVTLAVVLIILFGLLFPLSSSTGGGFNFGALWDMILDIIPGSFFEPFNTGNALQILFLSFVIGFLMLSSISRLEPVVRVIEGLYQIIQDMMALVLKALPLVVFVSLFALFSGSADIDLRVVYQYPLLQLVLSIGWLAAVIVKISVKMKVRPAVLAKKLMPTFLIAFYTSSSNASLSTSMDTCEKDLGIDPGLVKVGIPLAHSVDKPTAMILLMTGTMCMARMFSVDISWTALITMTLTVFLLAIAGPPVPGGGLSVTTLLFTIYGIPLEALSIIISLDVITDRIVTTSIVANAQLDLLQAADKLGDLDRDVLRR